MRRWFKRIQLDWKLYKLFRAIRLVSERNQKMTIGAFMGKRDREFERLKSLEKSDSSAWSNTWASSDLTYDNVGVASGLDEDTFDTVMAHAFYLGLSKDDPFGILFVRAHNEYNKQNNVNKKVKLKVELTELGIQVVPMGLIRFSIFRIRQSHPWISSAVTILFAIFLVVLGAYLQNYFQWDIPLTGAAKG